VLACPIVRRRGIQRVGRLGVSVVLGAHGNVINVRPNGAGAKPHGGVGKVVIRYVDSNNRAEVRGGKVCENKPPYAGAQRNPVNDAAGMYPVAAPARIREVMSA